MAAEDPTRRLTGRSRPALLRCCVSIALLHPCLHMAHANIPLWNMRAQALCTVWPRFYDPARFGTSSAQLYKTNNVDPVQGVCPVGTPTTSQKLAVDKPVMLGLGKQRGVSDWCRLQCRG